MDDSQWTYIPCIRDKWMECMAVRKMSRNKQLSLSHLFTKLPFGKCISLYPRYKWHIVYELFALHSSCNAEAKEVCGQNTSYVSQYVGFLDKLGMWHTVVSIPPNRKNVRGTGSKAKLRVKIVVQQHTTTISTLCIANSQFEEKKRDGRLNSLAIWFASFLIV